MSIYTDPQHDIELVQDQARFFGSVGESGTLQPGKFFDVVGDVLGGRVVFSVESLDFREPSFVREEGPRADPEYVTYYNCVAITVGISKVNPDGSEEPVETRKTKGGTRKEGDQGTEFSLDAGPIDPLVWNPVKWRLRVENTSRPKKIVTAHAGLRFIRDVGLFGTGRIPLRVLNHSLGVAVNALAPHAEAHGRTLRYGFGEELAQTLHLEEGHPLRGHTVPLPVEVDGELQSVDARVVPGSAVRQAVHDRWKKIDDKLAALGGGSLGSAVAALREKNTKWREEWEAKIEPDLVAVRITALVSDIDLSANVIPGFDFDLGSIEDISISLYFVFERLVGFQSGHVLFFASADYEGAVSAGNALGIVPDVGEILDTLAEEIRPHIGLLHRYFAEFLARLSVFLGGLPPIFIDARADESAVTVRTIFDPRDQRATRPEPEPTEGSSGGRIPDIRLDDIVVDRDGMTRDPGDGEVDVGEPGRFPEGFAVGDPASVSRLDRIETIVVVMMENRSFDHYFGYLREEFGDKYRCFRRGASNTYSEDGVSQSVEMVPVSDFLRADDVMQIRVDPHHGTNHVRDQIADGAMSGFAQDILDKGQAQVPLTYYTSEQLPNLHTLATEYMLCDMWFSTHPGGTYPNRWASLSGTMPDLFNIGVDDPRLGFIRDPTILDYLTSKGIGWTYYENNVSMIRMYSRFRLDDSNVLPFLDPDEGFEARARAGTLPPVVFVEPRITGIPPLEQASDDHPPANIGVGQQFLTRVYNTLRESPQWDRSMLVVTYDEHGGFYDHVAPPGTRLGPPEWRGKVPKIHPDGADHMGARVPTLVISPFVGRGSVSHRVFDHTSIIKTILVRHRAKFVTRDFGNFGPRVMMIDHLGSALDLDQPRTDCYGLLPAPPLRQRLSLRSTRRERSEGRHRPTAPPSSAEREDFGRSLARAMIPKPA